jgi:hypothetical protein
LPLPGPEPQTPIGYIIQPLGQLERAASNKEYEDRLSWTFPYLFEKILSIPMRISILLQNHLLLLRAMIFI